MLYYGYMIYKSFLENTAREAGGILEKAFRNPHAAKTSLKSRHELVTAYDVAAERVIMRAIRKQFSDHEILSEESGRHATRSDYLWIIDPLDGTTNFTIKHPIFSTTFALAYKGDVLASVIYAPILKEMYVAEKDKGATLNGKRLVPSSTERLNDSVLTFCYTHSAASHKRVTTLFSYYKTRARNFRHLGCASMELAFVAAGRIDGFMVMDGKPWDMAAGALLVQEAGGVVSDFQGRGWQCKSKGIIAAGNKRLHKVLVQSGRKILPT
ncbi:MAG: inositol monophosphatase [Parcubacteria group bacterium CG11_big_fil_rev_8_21_14_0_20_48_46]|nr:MAG: inositol monophosphatase [Parcubacteria group bacterium CG_4_8_14_3_um_filter_48_16]PJC39544.1 MAG: inositol monophosphatase [Parcubacteria group bacterium CG_4_9_14_0_2_um_filter_48_40]PJE53089.1 MAG: inositol monophosphatase [Parcubacteria group bacterium CG11_big_fil_rev_8_21_14_0_20_48_46]